MGVPCPIGRSGLPQFRRPAPPFPYGNGFAAVPAPYAKTPVQNQHFKKGQKKAPGGIAGGDVQVND